MKQKTTYYAVRESVLIQRPNGEVAHHMECVSFGAAKDTTEKLCISVRPKQSI